MSSPFLPITMPGGSVDGHVDLAGGTFDVHAADRGFGKLLCAGTGAPGNPYDLV
jgi:hypothetical protein